MRPKTMIAVAATIALVSGGIYAWTEYNRGPAESDTMPVKESVTANALYQAFSSDEKMATDKFVGPEEQVIQVSGTIRGIGPASEGRIDIVLETDDAFAGVVCTFETENVPTAWKVGESVAIKGICTGMLLDVLLVRCKAV